MSKVCVNKDERLLMLAHGQLGFLDQLKLRWHVRTCPKCQARFARYTSLSGALAMVMASPTGPRCLPLGAGKAIATRGAFMAGVILLLVGSFLVLRSSAEATTPPDRGPAIERRSKCGSEAENIAVEQDCAEKKTICAPTS